VAKALDFCFGKRDWSAIEPYKPHYTRNLEELEPVAQRQACEDIAGKKRQLYALAPIFPPVDCLVEGQKSFDGALLHLLRDTLLMLRSRVDRVPTRFVLV
jgi:hypothetical protein